MFNIYISISISKIEIKKKRSKCIQIFTKNLQICSISKSKIKKNIKNDILYNT